MMDSRHLLEDLDRVLEQETQTAEQLLAALYKEREALGKRDLDTTGETARKKDTLIIQLESLAARQNELLTRAGIDPGTRDLADALKSAGLGALLERWQALRDVLAQCRHQNLINGGVIEMSRRFAQQVLDGLRGASPDGKLYGPDGDAKSESGSSGPLATV